MKQAVIYVDKDADLRVLLSTIINIKNVLNIVTVPQLFPNFHVETEAPIIIQFKYRQVRVLVWPNPLWFWSKVGGISTIFYYNVNYLVSYLIRLGSIFGFFLSSVNEKWLWIRLRKVLSLATWVGRYSNRCIFMLFIVVDKDWKMFWHNCQEVFTRWWVG